MIEDNAAFWGLLLDYDGTLTPIVPNPSDAILSAEGRALLRELAAHPQVQCAIVSGRDTKTLKALSGFSVGDPLMLCGLHGGEILDLSTECFIQKPDAAFIPAIQAFAQALSQSLEKYLCQKFLLIENKSYSLALHTRQAPLEISDLAREVFLQLSKPYLTDFRIQSGKEVIELLPASFHKGPCVQRLWEQWQERIVPEQAMRLLYAGDDLTDESAFAVVNRLGGVSIRVGLLCQNTAALHQLERVADLYGWLKALLAGFSR
jgi:trehalose-phosphatase